MKKTVSIVSIITALLLALATTIPAFADTDRKSQILANGYDIQIDEDIAEKVSYKIIDSDGHVTEIAENETRNLRCCMTIITDEAVTVNYEELSPKYNEAKGYNYIKVIFDIPMYWEEETTEQTSEISVEKMTEESTTEATTVKQEKEDIPAAVVEETVTAVVVPETDVIVVPEPTEQSIEPSEPVEETTAIPLPETTAVRETIPAEKEEATKSVPETTSVSVDIPDFSISIPDVTLPDVNITINKTEKQTVKAAEQVTEQTTAEKQEETTNPAIVSETISADTVNEPVPDTGSHDWIITVVLAVMLSALVAGGLAFDYIHDVKHEKG